MNETFNAYLFGIILLGENMDEKKMKEVVNDKFLRSKNFKKIKKKDSLTSEKKNIHWKDDINSVSLNWHEK